MNHQTILARKNGKTRSQFIYTLYLFVKDGVLTPDQAQELQDSFDQEEK